jgi:hypothetical protein
MELGELTSFGSSTDPNWECPFAHDKKGTVKNDLRPEKSKTLQTSLANGTSTRKWEDVSGAIKPKRVKDAGLAEKRNAAVSPPHTVQVVLDHLGNTVTLPFSLSAHHLIPSDASLPKSSLLDYIKGGNVIESDIGYGVNGAENGVWLPTHQELSQNMPVLPFETEVKKYAVISGEGASHDVPVSVVARDPAVLDRVAEWGWPTGMRPGPGAPVWPMNAFRDRVFTAFRSG